MQYVGKSMYYVERPEYDAGISMYYVGKPTSDARPATCRPGTAEAPKRARGEAYGKIFNLCANNHIHRGTARAARRKPPQAPYGRPSSLRGRAASLAVFS